MSEIDKSALSQKAHEWARLFARSLDEWCKSNGVVPKLILKDQLGIPTSAWERISSGNGITDKVWYACVYYRTGVPEADPRTIPPRAFAMPNGNIVTKGRAMTEGEWQEWLRNHVLEADSRPPPIQPPPAEVERNNALPLAVAKGKDREYRHVLQRRFDALFEQVMSEVIPRYPDPQDDGSIDQVIWALKSVFEKLAKMDVPARTQFAREHGRTLASIFPFIEAYTLPDEKKRERALSLIFGFNANRELTQE